MRFNDVLQSCIFEIIHPIVRKKKRQKCPSKAQKILAKLSLFDFMIGQGTPLIYAFRQIGVPQETYYF